MTRSKRTPAAVFFFLFFLNRGWCAEAGPSVVRGSLTLVEETAGGQKRAVARKDLSKCVVYLVPDGHDVPVKTPKERLQVVQKNAEFIPEIVVAVLGQTVDFLNEDDILHNVYSYADPKVFDLGLFGKGLSMSVYFDKPGLVPFLCSIHSNMNGTVFVTPNHLFGISDEKGNFRIEGVPPGRYEVRAWHPWLPGGASTLEVPAGAGPVALTVELGGGQ